MGNQNVKKQESQALEIGRKITMGVMVGMAIGWVLIKRMTHPSRPGVIVPSSADALEIDITEPNTVVVESKPAIERKPTLPDDLESIRGIGPAYAQRLREAGITTFKALADQTPEHLSEIVQARVWQAIEPQSWIDQAREFDQLAI